MDVRDIKIDIRNIIEDIKSISCSEYRQYTEYMLTILEWIEDFFHVRTWEVHIIDSHNWTKIKPLLYVKTRKKLHNKDEEAIFSCFLDETATLLNTAVTILDIALKDFDLLHFNLSPIFGKDADAVVEQARYKLQNKILEKKSKELEKNEIIAKKPSDRDDLSKQVIAHYFNFVHKPQTRENFYKTIQRHKNTLLSHKITFNTFANRLYEATKNARAKARVQTRLRAQEVHSHIKSVSEKFRKKSQSLSSENTFKQNIEKSRMMIKQGTERASSIMNSQKDNFQEIISKNVFKENIIRFFSTAQHKIVEKGQQLASHREKIRYKTYSHSIEIKEKKSKESLQAQKHLIKKSHQFYKKVGEKQKYIENKGLSEIADAQHLMGTAKNAFQSSVILVEKQFAEKKERLKSAEKKLLDAKNIFNSKKEEKNIEFVEKSADVTDMMKNNLISGSHELSEKIRLVVGNIDKKKEMAYQEGEKTFAKIQEGMHRFERAPTLFQRGQNRFELKSNPFYNAQERIDNQSARLTEQMRSSNTKMKEKINEKKALFALDVRFAKYKLKTNALNFRIRTLDAQEEFQEKITQTMQRHRAKQKAHLIRNLLKTIRSMK